MHTAPAPAPQTLSETGSSLMAPLFALWGPAYHSRFSQVTLNTKSSSSAVGISSAAAGTADIGTSDAYLSWVHLKLNGELLARMFSGRITRWNDPAIPSLNPGANLPDSAIVPVHRADGSGSPFLFSSYLNAQNPADWDSSLIGTKVAWPRQPGEIGADGSGPVISSVRSAPGSIGYVGVSYLSEVTRVGEGGSDAQAYPMINYEYAVVSTSQSSAAKAQDLQAFLNWAITSGTSLLSQVNFQRLPSSVVTLSQAQIAKIKE
jgi:phosphate transport system substrate-binding protein